LYIAIEGIDTAGKTTQMRMLQEKFNDAVFIKEPGQTSIGQQIRHILLNEHLSQKTELLLFLADRAETIDTIIVPNNDKLIISDRSLVSGIAYALFYYTFELLKQFNDFATGGRYPDVVVLLRLDKETLISRLAQKSHDTIEQRGVEYLMRVQDNLITTLEKLNIKYELIDASLAPRAIHDTITNIIKANLIK